jgi:hypothetical protein
VIPKGTRTAFRAEGEQSSERSDAGTSIVEQVFGFVKKNLSGAQRRQAGTSEERGVGKGAQSLSPPHHGRDPACESAGNGAGSEGVCRLAWLSANSRALPRGPRPLSLNTANMDRSPLRSANVRAR